MSKSKPVTKYELPDGLVMDILSKLPVKSLLRFRCVNRSWCTTFQTPYFTTKHQLNSNRSLFLINFSDNYPYYSLFSVQTGKQQEQKAPIFNQISIPVPIYMRFCYFAGPCNGLLCLFDLHGIALWNPSTREVRVLPKARCPAGAYGLVAFGFGYEPKTNDYKVLFQSTNYVKDVPYQVELYTLSTNSWRSIPAPEAVLKCDAFLNAPLDGVYYWPAVRKGTKLIVSFDMADEVLSTLPLPSIGESWDDFVCYLASPNGSLAAIVYPPTSMEKCFHLWVLNVDSWTKQLTVGPVLGLSKPLGFWKNGELFLTSTKNELVMFDPHTKKFHNFGKYKELHNAKYVTMSQLIVYVESMARINQR